jgi:hypothetical protein
MSWCFAIVNRRLAEIYFDKTNGQIEYRGHCYVRESEYKILEERKLIKEDTEKLRLVYRAGKYTKID